MNKLAKVFNAGFQKEANRFFDVMKKFKQGLFGNASKNTDTFVDDAIDNPSFYSDSERSFLNPKRTFDEVSEVSDESTDSLQSIDSMSTKVQPVSDDATHPNLQEAIKSNFDKDDIHGASNAGESYFDEIIMEVNKPDEDHVPELVDAVNDVIKKDDRVPIDDLRNVPVDQRSNALYEIRALLQQVRKVKNEATNGETINPYQFARIKEKKDNIRELVG